MSDAAGFHEMREPVVEKVVVHMGVGQGGRELADAEEILEAVTGQESVRTRAKATRPEFGIREGDPIGTKVTLRGDDAEEFLATALELATIERTQFDETGTSASASPSIRSSRTRSTIRTPGSTGWT